jgi:RNA recognition motif-containing protein
VVVQVFLQFNVTSSRLVVSAITNIFVGSLPWATDDQQLQDLFSKHGDVTSAKVIKDKMTGRSKGFGFVEMPDDAQAKAAIEALNGSDFEGRKLVVNVARPREDRPDNGGGRRDDMR